MKPICIDPLIKKIVSCVKRHELSVGCYARWTFGDNCDLGKNEYGCADAANILYTVGEFPKDPSERAEWVRHLQSMQDPSSGMYVEATHNTIHTTAHCTAALLSCLMQSRCTGRQHFKNIPQKRGFTTFLKTR